MSYHADMLGQHMMHSLQPTVVEDRYPHPQYGNDSSFSDVRKINNEVQESSLMKKNILVNEDKLITEKEEGCESIDEIILESNDLIDNSPWALAMDKYLDKDLDIDLDLLLDEALFENPVTKEKESSMGKNNADGIKSSNKDVYSEDILSRSSGFISVIQGPELIFSTEENNFLQKNKIIHKDISRRAMPTSLHQACVARYLGKLSMDGMLSIIAGGRKAQNYYHFMTMSSQPFFNELTVR